MDKSPISSTRSLSGIKDVDLKILSELGDEDLFTFCKNFESKNRYINKLCSDDNFWKNRFIKKYGKTRKETNRTWKTFYLKAAYYEDKFKNNLNQARQELSIENLDIRNFFSDYLGRKALQRVLDNDEIDNFEIFINSKRKPLTWNSEYDDNLLIDMEFKIEDLLITITNNFTLYSYKKNEEQILTKKELKERLNEISQDYRIEHISVLSNHNYDFDLKNYLK